MTRQSICAAIVLVSVFVVGATAWAAGAAVNESGPRGVGMANALTAVADRPQTLVHNPAGLAQQDGLGVDLSLSLVVPRFGYDTVVPGTGEAIRVDAHEDNHLVPSGFVSYRVHERFAVGFGVHAPFGLGIKWRDMANSDTAWWGRNQIQVMDITTVYMRPTVAYNWNDRVYLGASVLLVQSAIEMKRAVTSSDNPDDDVQLTLSGSDFGVGGAAGLLVKVVPDFFNLGVAYRSAVGMTYEGDAVFTKDGSGDAIPSGLRQELTDGRAQARFTFPHKVLGGLAFFPNDRWTISTNIEYVTWSVVEDLTIEFLDNPQLTTTQDKDWSNVVKVSVGAEYEVLENNLPIRLGFLYDPSPVPDYTVGPELPDVDRFLVSAGLGYTWKGFTVDLSYEFIIGLTQDTSPSVPISGSRSMYANVVALGLGYNVDL